MNILMRSALALTVMSLGLAQVAFADEALIRKNLAERLPNFPAIDEVSKTPIPGLYEVRIGTELIYTDERGDHVIQGSIIETKTRSDLTQARIDKITAIDFAALPLKDAIVWKQGTGARKLVVFADPNCGYCKKFETEMQQVKDVTVYTFLYPILGGDSPEKSKNIWCAKDRAAAWDEFMHVILVGTGYNEGGSVTQLADFPGVDAIVDSLLDAATLLVESLHKNPMH